MTIYGNFWIIRLVIRNFTKARHNKIKRKHLFQIKNKNTLGETFFAYKDGLLITLSNPKTISFYLAFVPAIFGASSLKEQTFYLIIITILILAIIGSLYIFFSWGLKKFLRNLKIQYALLKGLSLTMCILALSMIYREFTPHLIWWALCEIGLLEPHWHCCINILLRGNT